MKNIFYVLSLLVFVATTSCSNDDDGGNTNETPKNNAKAITTFTFNAAGNENLNENIAAVINENDKTITAAVPYGTDITSLLPTIEVSEGATVSPKDSQDFSSEVVYTVTAQDGTIAEYTLHLTIATLSSKEVLIAIYNANPGNTLGWDLEDPDINNWDGVTTDEYGNVTGLELGARKLASVPAEIGQLSNLEWLTLYWNQLASIPAEIGKLANLIVLDLNFNQLTSVPSEIGQLSNLTSLHLYHNQLTSVPTEIGQLANLTGLYLENNQLTSVPAEIGQLSNLTELYLHDNQLTSVPVEIGQLSNLSTLSLLGNQLTSIPKEVWAMKENYGTTISVIGDLPIE